MGPRWKAARHEREPSIRRCLPPFSGRCPNVANRPIAPGAEGSTIPGASPRFKAFRDASCRPHQIGSGYQIPPASTQSSGRDQCHVEEASRAEVPKLRSSFAVVAGSGFRLRGLGPQPTTDRASFSTKMATTRVDMIRVDMNGRTCKVPLAIEYIEKVEKAGKVGKKRKTIKPS